VTAPRLALFRPVTRHSPLSMARLIAAGRADGIDQVTVYRTVDLFKKLGFVDEVGLGRNRLFELSNQYQAHHHHATCSKCGKIIDFDSQSIEDGIAEAARQLGFTVSSHQLEVVGLCHRCQPARIPTAPV
jgi:Fur family ferric uptake transcriptional regulator